jgi:hypothetical protein
MIILKSRQMSEAMLGKQNIKSYKVSGTVCQLTLEFDLKEGLKSLSTNDSYLIKRYKLNPEKAVKPALVAQYIAWDVADRASWLANNLNNELSSLLASEKFMKK